MCGRVRMCVCVVCVPILDSVHVICVVACACSSLFNMYFDRMTFAAIVLNLKFAVHSQRCQFTASGAAMPRNKSSMHRHCPQDWDDDAVIDEHRRLGEYSREPGGDMKEWRRWMAEEGAASGAAIWQENSVTLQSSGEVTDQGLRKDLSVARKLPGNVAFIGKTNTTCMAGADG